MIESPKVYFFTNLNIFINKETIYVQLSITDKAVVFDLDI